MTVEGLESRKVGFIVDRYDIVQFKLFVGTVEVGVVTFLTIHLSNLWKDDRFDWCVPPTVVKSVHFLSLSFCSLSRHRKKYFYFLDS